MVDQTPLESRCLQAANSSSPELGGKSEIGAWWANMSSRSGKQSIPDASPSHRSDLEFQQSCGDGHYDTPNRPRSPTANRNGQQINSGQSVGLETGPTEGKMKVSDKVAVNLGEPVDQISLEALLEKIRQANGTDQVELLRVCFGEPGVDLNVHIQGDFTVTLL
ncbi:hypothetical protein BDV26DRAFT_296400 [Aspergillus bertholletiae]|uniref:Uncharacterized protein n=1 Tax=Aspergillus bertholletiae TaxID=1226010 RepID=A0A5N7AVW4_9EURO|nr:hypothetical protein BDV26DRAFT_296400 [Aspergillus bertholletiae]